MGALSNTYIACGFSGHGIQQVVPSHLDSKLSFSFLFDSIRLFLSFRVFPIVLFGKFLLEAFSFHSLLIQGPAVGQKNKKKKKKKKGPAGGKKKKKKKKKKS